MKIGSFAAIVILCFPLIVFSQSAANTGSIYGTLQDSSGKPLSKVRVQLQSDQIAPIFTSTTLEGNFRFVHLSPGRYSIAIYQPGYIPIKQEAIVSIGQRLQFDLVLESTSIETASISGWIKDTNELPLGGVKIKLESEILPHLEAITGADGSFQFKNLPIGKYILYFKKKGYLDAEPQQVQLSSGETRLIEVQMTLSHKPSKEVTSNLKKSTEISWTYTADVLRTLPLSDSIYALLDHTPAIEINTISTVHSDPGFASLFAWFAGRGADFYSNLWTYDGLNVSVPDRQQPGAEYIGNFPSFFDIDNAEEVQIITAGNDISLASPGITVNIVSKRAGSEWHGGASFYYSNHNLQSENTPDEVINDSRIEGSRTFLLDDLEEINFNLGGPVLEDKLFIWGAYHRERLDRFHLDEGLIGYKSTSFSLKTNWDINSVQKLQFSYFNADDVNIYPDGGKEFLKPEKILPGIWSVQYNWTLDPNTLIHAGYGYIGAGFQRDYISEQAGHDVTFEYDSLRENLLGGDHQLRLGLEYKTSGFRDLYNDHEPIYSISPSSQDSNHGSIEIAYPETSRYSRINRFSLYGNDSYQKGRFTVDLGLRFDRQNGKNEPRTIPSPLDVFGAPDAICTDDQCLTLGPGFDALLPALEYPGKDPGITFDDFSPPFFSCL